MSNVTNVILVTCGESDMAMELYGQFVGKRITIVNFAISKYPDVFHIILPQLFLTQLF
jgi:hypothetical protein